MKTLIFSLIVLLSGYYLLSQTDSGSTLLAKVLPGQQIEQSTNELLNQVDSRLQDFTAKHSAAHQQKIQQLEQQIAELTAQLTAQPNRSPDDDSADTDIQTKQSAPQQLVNDALNLPPAISQIKTQTATPAPNVGNTALAQHSVAQTTDNGKLIRQKQASLQDIAARMEQLSLQVSSGNY